MEYLRFLLNGAKLKHFGLETFAVVLLVSWMGSCLLAVPLCPMCFPWSISGTQRAKAAMHQQLGATWVVFHLHADILLCRRKVLMFSEKSSMKAVFLLPASRDFPLCDGRGLLCCSVFWGTAVGRDATCLHGMVVPHSCRLLLVWDKSLLSTMTPLSAGHISNIPSLVLCRISS